MTIKEFVGFSADGTTEGHRRFYATAVEKLGYDNVRSCIEYTDEELAKAYAKDIHLNNLPLEKWDAWSGFWCRGGDCTLIGSKLTRMYRANGINAFSNAQGVCILKECARMAAERYMKEVSDEGKN